MAMARRGVELNDEALQSRVYQGLQKKKKCELCMQHFFVDELPGAITYKSILELRATWGRDVMKGSRMPSPSQLYKRCELCVFCMQFFDVDGLQDAPGATVKSDAASTTQRSPPGSPHSTTVKSTTRK